MHQQFMLLESNPQLGLKNGIYQDTTELFRDSKLSNYIQVAVADLMANVDDKTLFSTDIERASNTDELRQAVSTSQYQFLQAFDLSHVNTVLDISEDLGGVAHYLADRVGQIEALKIDPDRARLSVNRCANNHNVCHVSEDLNKLTFPVAHYDLIVLGQLESLGLSSQAFTQLLKNLRAALTPSGVLVLTAINQNRISRWFNPHSLAHPGTLDFADLYHTQNEINQTIEFSRKRLRDILLDCDFAAIDFHANFSQGTDCRALFSEDYLTSSVNGLNHFYRLGAISNSSVNEYLLFKRLVEEKHNLVDCANRFLVIAGASSSKVRDLYDNDFSHFPGTGRKPQWRTITSRKRAANNVDKKSSYTTESKSALIKQNLEPQPFHKGPILVGNWLEALLENDHRRFEKLVQEYADWLEQLATQANFNKVAYDLLPFNLIVNERRGRHFQTIDTEWQLNTEFSADFVLFRALFWFAFENKTLLKHFANNNDLNTLGMFVVRYMPSIHQVEELNTFVELEEQVQAEIDNQFRANSVAHALLQSFDKLNFVADKRLIAQAVWGDSNGVMAEEHSKVTKWSKRQDTQTISIDLADFDANKPVLRIDPLACEGAFSFNSIEIIGSDDTILWSLDSAVDIDNRSTTSGIKFIGDRFIALNDDPYFLFDLSVVDGVQTARSARLELAWYWAKGYSAALDNFASALSNQNAAIIGQSHRLNQYRADNEYQAQRIKDILGHRKDLTLMLKDEEARAKRTKNRMQAEIDHLNARLHAQHVRNDELHGYLLMRPTTRGKRVARRWLNRLTGKPIIEAEPEPEIIEEPVDLSPLPTGELIGQNTEDYQLWISENTMNETQIEAAKADIEAMPNKPVFSILVPIYNTDPEYLLPMIESVQKQIYPYWQLCLVDDCSPKSYLKRILEHEALQDERISIQLNDVNQGISVTTNDALAMAKGDYIALLDHDDEISIDALYENAKVINATPEAGLIYSDEDKMDMQGGRLEPYFKPDYSPDLLHTNNYICHFTVIKKSITDEIGGFREGLDGSQDHDVILRAAAASEQVIHIPRILYHWRKIPGSTAVVYDSKSYAWEAGRKAVEDLLKKQEDGVRVEFGTLKGTYRVFREIKGEPLVSIIIPFKDKPELLDSCLNSILNRSSYRNIEIIGVSNNSEEPLTFERMEHFKQLDQRVRFVEKDIPFNFSAICNYGVEHASGEFIVLLNNDIEIISPDWIERMLEHAQGDDIGAVGGKLLYPDGRIQHAGVVAGMVGAAGHPHKFFPDNHIGYHGRLHMVYNVSAVTGAMMMMRTDKFKQVGGLDEDNLAVAYNDIDLCLKLLDAGYRNVFTPHSKATHHESISRGYEDTDEKVQRLLKEQSHFLSTWADFLESGDPYYNPNLSLKNERFSLKFKD